MLLSLFTGVHFACCNGILPPHSDKQYSGTGKAAGLSMSRRIADTAPPVLIGMTRVYHSSPQSRCTRRRERLQAQATLAIQADDSNAVLVVTSAVWPTGCSYKRY